ncbi:MAG: PPC domain-containing protein, partial [Acidimicrobiia bacterium]|nr:PPC domain-containing protein [Acidimicrobiia bacterium]
LDLTALSAGGSINGRISPAIYEYWPFGTPNDVGGQSISITAPKEFVDKNETNDSIPDATKIKLPFSSGDQVGDSPNFNYTDISPVGGDVDFFEIDLEADTTLLVEVTSGALDSLVGLFDASGNLLAVDDDGGAGLLSRLAFPVPATGTYYLAVTTFGDFDFTGGGFSGSRYVVEVETFDGILLILGDDDSEEVPFQNFDFPFQGAMWSSVWVNSNGNLTFGAGDSDFTESVSEFLNETPRIAALWDDLSPNNGGRVTVARTADSMVVSFEDVPEFSTTGANTFAVTMFSDGGVNIQYGATNGNDGLVGITEGGGAANPGETDLSSAGALSATGTTYEVFSSGEFDLDFLGLAFTP